MMWVWDPQDSPGAKMNSLTRWTVKVACLLLISSIFGCDPFVSEEAFNAAFDRDNDGVPRPEDCDDNNASVTIFYFYRDLDNDGHGAGEKVPACSVPEGMTVSNDDCNDANDKMHPGSIEVCDQLDNDCDGETDEGFSNRWYQDKDKDGKGNPNVFVDSCAEPPGHVANSDDCDDENDLKYIGALELCDDVIDNDCDGVTDNAEGAVKQYLDDDEDQFGREDMWLWGCEVIEGYVKVAGDCDDSTDKVGPSVAELCNNNIDDDCDGVTDTDSVMSTWYQDLDVDSFGNAQMTLVACEAPQGYVADKTDCDDTAKAVNPSVQEVCNNGIDDNCDDSFNSCVLSGNVSLADPDSTLSGATADQKFGSVVTSCDINNDGQPDVVVGSPGFGGNRGRVDIFFANVSGVKTTDNSNIRILGEVGTTRFGEALACADTNGDNKDDLLVGASGKASNRGAAYLFKGLLIGPEIQATAASTTWNGKSQNDRLGSAVAILTKITALGDRAIAIAIPRKKNDQNQEVGAVLLYKNIQDGALKDEDADTVMLGVGPGSFTGNTLVVGDFNADTLIDIAVSAHLLDDPQNDTGGLYIVHAPYEDSEDLIGADATWTGLLPFQHVGFSMAAVDINDDGKMDIVVGAYGQDGAADQGSAYVILAPFAGKKSLSLAHAILNGPQAGDWFGRSVSAGDVNHDGKPDILVGAPRSNVNGVKSGAVYAFNNNAQGQVAAVAALFTAQGPAIGSEAGSTLFFSPDVTGDGLPDILTGSPSNTMKGTVWILSLLGL